MNIRELKELIKDLDDDVEIVDYDERGQEGEVHFYVDSDDYKSNIPVKLVVC